MRSLQLFFLIAISGVVRGSHSSKRRLSTIIIASNKNSNYDGRRAGDRNGNGDMRFDRDNYYGDDYSSSNDDSVNNGSSSTYDYGRVRDGRYDGSDADSGKGYSGSRQQQRQLQSALVESYMRSFPSRMLVALSAAASGFVVSMFISKMVVSKAPIAVPAISSVLFFVFCFFPGNFGDLSRALGVFLIILLRHTTFTRFLLSLLSYSKSVLRIASRRPFPPGTDNPWTYSPLSQSDPDFKMINALLAVVLASGYCGLTLSKRIPFFPGWIGSLAGALTCGYFATGRDSSGDFIRFVGYGFTTALAEMLAASDDVKLQEKLSTVLSTTLSLGMKIDSQYNLVKTFKFMLAKFVGFVSMVLQDRFGHRDNKRENPSLQQEPPMYDYDNRKSYNDTRQHRR